MPRKKNTQTCFNEALKHGTLLAIVSTPLNKWRHELGAISSKIQNATLWHQLRACWEIKKCQTVTIMFKQTRPQYVSTNKIFPLIRLLLGTTITNCHLSYMYTLAFSTSMNVTSWQRCLMCRLTSPGFQHAYFPHELLDKQKATLWNNWDHKIPR